MSAKSPLSQFTRVAGRYNTLATFVPMSNKNQESITGNARVDINCYNSKIYTRNAPIILRLGNGVQDGQLKKLTFVYKGSEKATATLECPALSGTYSEIVFSEVGDQILLLWTGGNWSVLETLNITNPSLQSPWVQ